MISLVMGISIQYNGQSENQHYLLEREFNVSLICTISDRAGRIAAVPG